MKTMSQAQTALDRLTVFYDGSCPICRKEIAFYRRRRGADSVHWRDVSEAAGDVAPGLCATTAMARFHVRLGDGSLASGGDAFREIWWRLPLLKPLAILSGAPGMPWLLNAAYDRFLPFRARLQAAAGRTDGTATEPLPKWLVGELRSDHAGETGAVWIYRGILSVSQDHALRRFSLRHMHSESRHVTVLEGILRRRQRSLFLPLWRIAGWITGALPALFSPNAVHATIDTVETFVDHHYQAQIDALDELGTHREIRDILERCRLDEVEHRDEARTLHAGRLGIATRVWCRLVEKGSIAACALARRM